MAKSVITVDDDATIVEAAKLMRVADIGAVPVVKKGTSELIGICTRTDLVDHLIRIMEPLEEETKSGV
jgi:CBS domain-containing protein